MEENKQEKAKKIGKYNPKTLKIIFEALKEGNTRTTAFKLAGIGVSTGFEWLAEKEDFRQQVEEAEAKALSDAVTCLKRASLTEWKAAAWFLERKEAEWHKVEKIDHTTNGKEIIFTIDFGRELTPEDDEDAEDEE